MPRSPRLIDGLGVLSLGYERLRKLVEWWLTRSAGFVRGWSLVACAFGAFLVYAAR